MGRTRYIVIAVVLAILCICAVVGVRYWEQQRTEKNLVGYWEQDNPMETFRESVQHQDDGDSEAKSDQDAAETQVSRPSHSADDGDAGGSIPITIPGLNQRIKKAISMKTSLHFEEGGLFTISSAGKSWTGRWVLSKARWKTATVIARVMQTPSFQQRLIMHIRFDDKDRIVISDEAGVHGTFHRSEMPSSPSNSSPDNNATAP